MKASHHEDHEGHEEKIKGTGQMITSKPIAIKRIVFLAIAIVIVLTIGYMVITIRQLKEKRTRTKEAMMQTEHICPEGSSVVIDTWGGMDMAGWASYCSRNGTKHGKWVAWADGKPRIEAYYENGTQVKIDLIDK